MKETRKTAKQRGFNFEHSIKSKAIFRNLFVNRMFHIDDVPSGAGEGIKDVTKALAVGKVHVGN